MSGDVFGIYESAREDDEKHEALLRQARDDHDIALARFRKTASGDSPSPLLSPELPSYLGPNEKRATALLDSQNVTDIKFRREIIRGAKRLDDLESRDVRKPEAKRGNDDMGFVDVAFFGSMWSIIIILLLSVFVH